MPMPTHSMLIGRFVDTSTSDMDIISLIALWCVCYFMCIDRFGNYLVVRIGQLDIY